MTQEEARLHIAEYAAHLAAVANMIRSAAEANELASVDPGCVLDDIQTAHNTLRDLFAQATS